MRCLKTFETETEIHSAVEPTPQGRRHYWRPTPPKLHAEDLRRYELVGPNVVLGGITFFNPVAKMQTGRSGSSLVINATIFRRARAVLIDQIGKLPVPVASAPGFLFTSALTPYLRRSHSAAGMKVCRRTQSPGTRSTFELPIGPIETGRSGRHGCVAWAWLICFASGSIAQPEDRSGGAPKWKRAMLGRRAERPYTGRTANRKSDSHANRHDRYLDRLILARCLNACMVACEKKSVAVPGPARRRDDLCHRFAPFTAGPMHYAAAAAGVGEVVQTQLAADWKGPRRTHSARSGWSRACWTPAAEVIGRHGLI